jgi:mannose-6-phosphate isomerase-like protein (cupin superfamily)
VNEQQLYLSQAGDGELLSGSTGIPYRLKANATATRGAYALLESVLPPGDTMPVPHIHHDHDEAFYVISGEVEVLAGDGRFSATGGAYVFIPRGLMHSYRNCGGASLTMLVISSPPGIEANFIEFAHLLRASSGQPLDRETTRAVGRRHGTEYFVDDPRAGRASGTSRA